MSIHVEKVESVHYLVDATQLPSSVSGDIYDLAIDGVLSMKDECDGDFKALITDSSKDYSFYKELETLIDKEILKSNSLLVEFYQ